ncbi:MAG: hypothetical protein LBL46_01010 [Rickettsiales bacterium]|jgi:hypothetical protein|nr:hypothetical protein [Rickettsiales bacterium]
MSHVLNQVEIDNLLSAVDMSKAYESIKNARAAAEPQNQFGSIDKDMRKMRVRKTLISRLGSYDRTLGEIKRMAQSKFIEDDYGNKLATITVKKYNGGLPYRDRSENFTAISLRWQGEKWHKNREYNILDITMSDRVCSNKFYELDTKSFKYVEIENTLEYLMDRGEQILKILSTLDPIVADEIKKIDNRIFQKRFQYMHDSSWGVTVSEPEIEESRVASDQRFVKAAQAAAAKEMYRRAKKNSRVAAMPQATR